MKQCCVALVSLIVFASALRCDALDREAFTISKYDLGVRIDPAQQRLGVRGKLTLRNDSAMSQKAVALQISSSLHWLSIRAGGKPLQFVAQNYNSDIDHSGALSEAIVDLPAAVPARNSIDLEIGYEGTIPLDASRLTRMGTPDEAARSTDWDQIGPQFTAVRGAGNVAWYPIITEGASLAQGNDLFDVLNRWKARETSATMQLHFAVANEEQDDKPELIVNASACPLTHQSQEEFVADCDYQSLGAAVPTFVIANYTTAVRDDIAVHFLSGHDEYAAIFADAAVKASPLISEWFGNPRGKVQIVDLASREGSPFESGSMLLIPLSGADAEAAGLIAAHQLTHAAFSSPRPWINEGLAHFAQVLYLEQEKGRQVALEYLQSHQYALTSRESRKLPGLAEDDSLITTSDDQFIRSKSLCVWWMLREMAGDQALKKALASYRPEQDKDPSYMQKLIETQAHRDFEWFFDDWVYRDRGLPDFKIESAFTRKMLPEGYMTTITVSNRGGAGAEVPIFVKSAGEVTTKRLVVLRHGSAVIRVETLQSPDEIVVNDGSVPENDMTNNAFRVIPATK